MLTCSLLIVCSVTFTGNVKVTTYEESTRDTFLEAGRPVCDLRIYPAGKLRPAFSQLLMHRDTLE